MFYGGFYKTLSPTAIADARDHHADALTYPAWPAGPGYRQGFDDWAADVVREISRRRAAMIAAVLRGFDPSDEYTIQMPAGPVDGAHQWLGYAVSALPGRPAYFVEIDETDREHVTLTRAR